MTLTQADRFARVILALFALAGIIYSVASPVLENPDEVYHYPLVKHLADGHGLPVQQAGVETMYAQEGSQPPLYYALMAGLTAWIDTDDLPELRYLNPHARVGIPLAHDNKNIVVHTDRERWPWHGATLAIHLIRLASVALGAGSLWCGYRVARRLFGARPEVALGATVFTAFNTMFLFISASVNNDNLITLLTSATLLMLVRLLDEGARWPHLLALGALCGLAALSKLSGLIMLPLCGLALTLRGWQTWRQERQPWQPLARRLLGQMASIGLVAVLIAGWWYARNLRLYGELTGMQTMLDIFGRRNGDATPLALWQEFGGFRISFWGLFGVVNVLLRPLWLYHLLDLLSLACLIGLGRWLRREWQGEVAVRWPQLALLAALCGGFGVSLLRWTSLTLASQGRLLFPALTALSLFMSLGLLALFRRQQQSRVVLALAIALGALCFAAPFTAIAPAYRRPPVLTRQEIPVTLPRVEATFQDEIRLVAYDLAPREVAPGEPMVVTLYWECLRPVTRDHSAYIHVFGLDGVKIAQRDTFPGMGNYAPTLWQPGEVIRDRYEVTIADGAAGPVAAQIEVGLYDLQTMNPLPVTDGLGQPVGRVLLERVKVRAPTAPAQPAHTVDALYGERVRLRGYDLPLQIVQPGQTAPLTLHWEALGPLPADYTVFIHLVSADGAAIGQGDGPPLGGEYPTSYWAAGEFLRDEHLLNVSADAPPGRARLLVGLYDPETGQRLPLGTNPDGAVEIATLEVAP
jgi:4-amino-4-deoxy-L-arabinose transferase-like glycosyltransferase